MVAPVHLLHVRLVQYPNQMKITMRYSLSSLTPDYYGWYQFRRLYHCQLV